MKKFISLIRSDLITATWTELPKKTILGYLDITVLFLWGFHMNIVWADQLA